MRSATHLLGMVSSFQSIVIVMVIVCPEIIGARMLNKRELEVPDFLADATTEMYETTEMPIPENCQENEEFSNSKCELHCGSPYPGNCHIVSPDKRYCVCQQGYARDLDRKCVLKEECSTSKLSLKACKDGG
ncbi:hypothetical protein Y032_0006g3053 [Ancylostoma ceylanicum]|uniref:TIL domain-containing protein n=2 Tax=Ancylostoma ceylanicum TaxID=53326 RepID=A0A016VQC5_9BILA|nr:hypothetical protein Y032_0006g3053 [Ancylostoma ceylanicum]